MFYLTIPAHGVNLQANYPYRYYTLMLMDSLLVQILDTAITTADEGTAP